MNRTRFPLIVVASIVLTALLSSYSIWKRYQVESQNRAVAIAAEYETIEALASAQAMPMGRALEDLKAQGLNTLVLSEDSVGGLLAQGKAILVAAPSVPGQGSTLALQFLDTSAVQRVQTALRIRFGNLAGSLTLRDNRLTLPPVSAQLIRSTPVGLDPNQAAVAQAAKLQIIARCSNTGGESSNAVKETLTWAHSMGASIFLPQGDEVIGRRDAMPDTIATLQSLPMYYASPEFAKIAGDTDVLEKAGDLVIRLHSAQTAELDKLSPIDAVERYVRAARERNMRVLLIRPLSFAAPEPLFAFDGFIKQITQELLKNGQVISAPHPFSEPGLPHPFFVILGLIMAPSIWFAVARFVESTRARQVGAGLLVLLALACWMKAGMAAMALLGSMTFPILGFFALDRFVTTSKAGGVVQIVAGFWIVSAFSIVGGMSVAGMLNSLAFYIRAAEFEAVKLSVFLPIVVVGCHYFMSLSDWKGTMKSSMTWGASALGLGLGLILAIMLARTGNDTGAGPSGGEMVFRNLLDRFLYVRPRTKEFMIGHPFLVFGIGMLFRTVRLRSLRSETENVVKPALAGWTVLALMLGAIGQTSVVNTMCHIHIPFTLSLARVLEGQVIGCIIGVVAWMLLGRLLPGREA